MKRALTYIAAAIVAAACTKDVQVAGTADESPAIFPDYKEVTVPANIAPLNFSYTGEEPSRLLVDGEYQKKAGRKGLFSFSKKEWRKLMAKDSVRLTVLVKESSGWTSLRPFTIYVKQDKIDSYVSYRLIPPGYQGWREMGIYQRNLENYTQSAIYENKLASNNCCNCHIPCDRDPQTTVFHARADFGGTFVRTGGRIEKLNTKTDSTISALVYPFWHPSGRFIAFSTNATKQSFFNHDPNRIEVFDSASDVVVYDVQNHDIFWSPLTKSADAYETFPAFSPDGKWLYFCSARPVEKMPRDYAGAHYDLKRIRFDAEALSFGDSLETVYDASSQGLSVSFPRISPDGRHLCFTRHGYGNFSIWHKDADLWMMDITTGNSWPMDSANSPDVESYHSWSGNSRWIVFSSRRDDGLYTRLYITYIDERGNASKPFLMPQKNPAKYYADLMFSYNIPEFMTGKAKVDGYLNSRAMRKQAGTNVGIKQQ